MAAPEIKRSRRLFGALLGTLAQFRKEDEKEKTSDAHQKRVNSLQRVCSHFCPGRDKQLFAFRFLWGCLEVLLHLFLALGCTV
jgi:hypothetical protein